MFIFAFCCYFSKVINYFKENKEISSESREERLMSMM